MKVYGALAEIGSAGVSPSSGSRGPSLAPGRSEGELGCRSGLGEAPGSKARSQQDRCFRAEKTLARRIEIEGRERVSFM
eukprot:6075112-Pyramimonas_sp.AAC.1